MPRTFIATPYDEGYGVFSPDGRWVAYTSDESGRKEVHVAAFPDASRRYRVSSAGGSQPRWSGGGRELLYMAGNSMMSLSVEKRGGELAFGRGRALFQKQLQSFGGSVFSLPSRYDVSADGRVLALLPASEERQPPLTLVFHWTEMLRRR